MAPTHKGEIPHLNPGVPLDEDERETLHRMAHQVDELHRLMLAWRPIIEAWQRGGLIGARNAAKRANHG